MKFFLSIFILLTTLGTPATFAKKPPHPDNLRQLSEFADLKATESIDLKYVPSNDAKPNQLGKPFSPLDLQKISLPKLTATKWSNGKYSIHGQGERGFNAPCASYEYKVDLKNKTYTLRPFDIAILDDSSLKLQSMDSASNTDTLKKVPNADLGATRYDESNGVCNRTETNTTKYTSEPLASSTSYRAYYATVSLRTRDLPNWTITKTTNHLRWIAYGNGSVNWLYWYARWFAVNPSPINTHWYIKSRAHWGPYPSGFGSTKKEVAGLYYNYDWGFDSRSTNVSQYVSIQGFNNGTFRYSWNHTDWGEDSFAIWGVLTFN